MSEIRNKGAVIILLFCCTIFKTTLYSQENYFPFISNGLWGFIDSSGAEVIMPEFLQAATFSDGLALVKVGKTNSTDPQRGYFLNDMG